MNLLVITGAGASHGLGRSPDAPIPLMHDWCEALCDALGPDLAARTGLYASDSGEAFEETLGALLRWGAALDEVERCSRGATVRVISFGRGLPQR